MCFKWAETTAVIVWTIYLIFFSHSAVWLREVVYQTEKTIFSVATVNNLSALKGMLGFYVTLSWSPPPVASDWNPAMDCDFFLLFSTVTWRLCCIKYLPTKALLGATLEKERKFLCKSNDGGFMHAMHSSGHGKPGEIIKFEKIFRGLEKFWNSMNLCAVLEESWEILAKRHGFFLVRSICINR